MVRVDFLILFLTLERLLQLFTIEYTASYRLFIYGLYYVEVYTLYAHFLGIFFYHEFILNFVKNFSHTY